MKPVALFLLSLFAAAVWQPAAGQKIGKYLNKYDSLAVEKMEEHEIPASVILGVSIVESGAGSSAICKALNNFFGIKGKNKSSLKKLGYKSAYKEYDDASASFEHFCQVLKKKKFYKTLKGSNDYKKWIQSMNASSYASAKQKWVSDILNTIKKYQLTKYDKLSVEDVITKKSHSVRE